MPKITAVRFKPWITNRNGTFYVLVGFALHIFKNDSKVLMTQCLQDFVNCVDETKDPLNGAESVCHTLIV